MDPQSVDDRIAIADGLTESQLRATCSALAHTGSDIVAAVLSDHERTILDGLDVPMDARTHADLIAAIESGSVIKMHAGGAAVISLSDGRLGLTVDSKTSTLAAAIIKNLSKVSLAGLIVADQPVFREGEVMIPILRSEIQGKTMTIVECANTLTGFAASVARCVDSLRGNAQAAHTVPIEQVIPNRGIRAFIDTVCSAHDAGISLAINAANGEEIEIPSPSRKHMPSPHSPKQRVVTGGITGCTLRHEGSHRIEVRGCWIESTLCEHDVRALLKEPQWFSGTIRKESSHWVILGEPSISSRPPTETRDAFEQTCA